GAPLAAAATGGDAAAPPAAARGRPASDAAQRPGHGTLGPPAHLSGRAREAARRLAGERKQVTVLFADVTGSMDLSERVDPERWREIMDRFFRLLAEAVHRFEGTVDKFTGDGIMAIFGAPIAHEDHAQRACFAALEMRETLGEYAAELRRTEGLNLTARVGINSGEVVVGAIGDDLSLSYTAVGHTVGLAQRMEALAEPGKAYVTETTADLAAGFLDLADLGEFEVKGSRRPLRVFELVGVGSARGRLDVARSRGLTRFVGRAAELAELDSALESAAGGEGTVVGVVADPGVGKSRLCMEFCDRARASGVEVYEAHCQAHTRDLPLLPVLEMVRSYFRIGDRDSAREAREKIAGRMLLLDPELADELPLVFDFLGVPDPERPAPRMEAEARRRRLLEVVGRLIGARGREGAAIMLVEDAHWIDPASEEFLAALAGGVAGTPTLVLVTFRPEFDAAWMGGAGYRTLALDALGGEALDELLDELLGADPSLDGLAEMVRDRTGGNPFFIEEVVRELAESGALDGERGGYRLVRQVDDVAIPRSVQSILAARIDRLDAGAKEVLGAAAVVGKDFSRELAVRASGLDGDAVDAGLAVLAEAEFISATALYPEPEYSFRHPLTREVALGSQLAERLAATHRRAAVAIQELEPDRLEENAALIAQHYDAAGDAFDAAGWYLRAAAWSRTNDQPATLAHVERIRELDDELPDGPDADGLRAVARVFLLGLGWRGGMEGSKMLDVFEEGRAAAERTGNDSALAALHGTATIALTVRGLVGEAIRHIPEALATAERSGDPATLAMVRATSSYPLFLAGRIDEALAAADSLVEQTRDDPSLGSSLGAESPHVWGISFRCLPLAVTGRLDEALAAVTEGEAVARRLGLAETLGWVHSFRLGYDHWYGSRDGALALGHGREAVEIAQEIGSSFSLVVALTWLGEAHRIAAEPEAALVPLEKALEIIESTGAGLDFEVYARWLLALALGDGGRHERAIEEAELAVRLARDRGVELLAPKARIAGARARIGRGGRDDLTRAAVLIAEADEISAALGAPAFEVQLDDCRARLAAAGGDHEGEREALEAGL
ncbi:MAG TPA: adenylate/guanylate cyclase domain-containing protein, partial [Solirubrobacterales bacterium]|nr:adenylate/guanylate cyclase domain-containing protein [Solirubrobacterales bacterium]